MDVFFSDFDSYSECGSSSSSEDQENDEFTYGGHASCILSNLEDTIGKIDDFLSFERGYMEGDVVCSVANPSGQTGKVINVEKVVDLESVHGSTKLKNIDSKKLQRVRSISAGDYVVAGPWVGKAGRVVDRVTVLFDDGTKCEFTTTAGDDKKLIPLFPSDAFDDSRLAFFPGQRVQAVRSSVFESTAWFCGTHKDEEQNEGTVDAVDAGFVYVNWLGCAQSGSEAPPSLQSSRDLTLLSCFSHSNWQIGDWCLTGDLHSGFQETFVIGKIKTKVDVLWQDGTESWGLDSGSVGPVNVLDAHDFWPHQFVIEKGSSDDQENKKWGVVKSVDSKEKTVKVKWETCSEEELENGIEEIVSAYELIEHPEFSYGLGDVVFGLEKGEKSSPTGIVVGFVDGGVRVKWAAGFTSKVFPNDIFGLDKCEGKPATSLLHDENIEPNQAKSEHDEHALNLKAKDSPDLNDDDESDCVKSLCHSNTFDVPRAAIGFLCNVVAHLFGSPTYTSFSTTSEGEISFDSEEESVPSIETHKIEENDDESNDVLSSSSCKNLDVEKFEMVSDYSTHHFADRVGKGSISNQVKRGWLKKVQQEWNILMKDLPDTIYVRVFEERMDLLRAAIVGAPGTPYHDALFFFDIFLPPEYPQEPPMVHYISGGPRLNPNLYESGRVCLSLLNTWAGTGTETWNPNGSTILQVLLSLQALVLNQNPYFNEAGYDQQVGSVEGEKNSCSYNENAFLVSCKSIIYTLRKPPKHFEALVEEHFRRRCTCILMACKAYVQGVPIGYAFEGEHTESTSQIKSSTGFQIALSKLFPKLVEAFSAKGLVCGNHEEM